MGVGLFDARATAHGPVAAKEVDAIALAQHPEVNAEAEVIAHEAVEPGPSPVGRTDGVAHSVAGFSELCFCLHKSLALFGACQSAHAA